MRREFKVDGYEFKVVNCTANNITELPYKYDLYVFNKELKGYTRVYGCKTLEQAKDKAIEYVNGYILN